MSKATPRPCTPQSCGKYFPSCGKVYVYKKRGCRCDPCREAAVAENRRYDEKRADKIAATNKAYRQANAAQISERKAAYYAKNREAVLASCRIYSAANSAKKTQAAQEWAARNPERASKNWRRGAVRRRARLAESSIVPFTQEQLEQRLAYYGNRCYLRLDCCIDQADHIDHVKPISKGGPHILSNLRPACQPCNQSKSNKWPYILGGKSRDSHHLGRTPAVVGLEC